MNEPSSASQLLAAFVGHLGEALIAGALAAIGWVMATFTRRHIESMDKLAERLGKLADDVGDMKSDIRSLREHQTWTDERVEKLEDSEHQA